MKSLRYFFLGLVLCGGYSVSAQESDEVTDEELKNYAIVMDSVETMRKSLLSAMTDMIKNNEEITANRYNELSKIMDDSLKLLDASATEAEVAAVNKIITTKDEGSNNIQDAFRAMVKDLLGASSYNKVKKALASDKELKAKYDDILAELSSAESD